MTGYSVRPRANSWTIFTVEPQICWVALKLAARLILVLSQLKHVRCTAVRNLGSDVCWPGVWPSVAAASGESGVGAPGPKGWLCEACAAQSCAARAEFARCRGAELPAVGSAAERWECCAAGPRCAGAAFARAAEPACGGSKGVPSAFFPERKHPGVRGQGCCTEPPAAAPVVTRPPLRRVAWHLPQPSKASSGKGCSWWKNTFS